MLRLLMGLLVLIGCVCAGCTPAAERPGRDSRLGDGRPQVEVTVQR